MKILQITHKFPPGFAGGSGNSAYILSKQLLQYGHEVKVIAFDNKNIKSNDEIYNDIHITRIKPNSANKIYNPNLTQSIKIVIDKFNPDIIHLHSIWTVGLAPLQAIRDFRGKIVMKLPDYDMICARGTMLKKDKSICTNSSYRNCIACVSPAIFLKQFFIRNYFFQSAKNIQLLAPSRHIKRMFLMANPRLNVKYFPNFYPPVFDRVDKLDKNSLKDKYQLKDKKVILFSGRIIETKGYQYLLQAMKDIKDPDAILIIVGNNIDGNKLYDYINIYKVEDKVKYLGNFPLEQLPEIYRISDILVVPSIWPDNSPNVIYEGLVSGLPIIGSDIGGIPDLVLPGKNGYLVPPKNSSALSNKIDLLLSNQEIYTKMSNFSKKLAQKYTSKQLVKDIINKYYIL